MVSERDLEAIPDVIDEKPWLALLLMERQPVLIHPVRYRRVVKIIYNVGKHVRKRETRHGIVISLILTLLLGKK